MTLKICIETEDELRPKVIAAITESTSAEDALGRAMRALQGRANPATVMKIVREHIHGLTRRR